MSQMVLQWRAREPDGTASVSSVFIIHQGERRENEKEKREREKRGEKEREKGKR